MKHAITQHTSDDLKIANKLGLLPICMISVSKHNDSFSTFYELDIDVKRMLYMVNILVIRILKIATVFGY